MPSHSGLKHAQRGTFSSITDLMISSASSTPMDISLTQHSSKMFWASFFERADRVTEKDDITFQQPVEGRSAVLAAPEGTTTANAAE